MGMRAGVAAGLVLASLTLCGPAHPAPAAAAPSAPVPGTGAPFPRAVYDPGSEALLQDRLTRDPYRSVFMKTHGDADTWDDRTLGDHSIEAQRDLTRAAKVRAFEYALDRTVVGGAIVAFPTPTARAAAGDFARDVLLQVYDRSRLAVPAPLGGWDRDISTSEEIVNAAETYDLLRGAGYDLGSGTGSDRAEIVRRLRSVTQELWDEYAGVASKGGITALHQNNHRTKSGASMALAAVVLADDVPADTARRWFDTGAGFVDDLQRHTLITGDGAYSEGAFYYAYTLQNLVPYLAMWERQLGAAAWQTADGLTIPALARTPLFTRTQRWMLDATMPDGSMASFDDASPNRSAPFGALPQSLPDDMRSAAQWRWDRQPNQLETWGNVDLAVESIVAYDDGIAPAAPGWSPTQFYVEGGNAMLRTSWEPDAAEALILGEHDTASEFGRDRTGAARFPQSHEHADPGAFVLHAFGERLAIDPGYLSFGDHAEVNQPEDHNVVLIDGKGPADYLSASFAWGDDPKGRPPAEGQSTIGDTLDAGLADAATVATDYRGAAIARRFLFGDDGYLVVADRVDAPQADHVSWVLHGNGGGTSGGSYASTATGGTWTIGGGRLSTGIATTAGIPTPTTATAVHEGDDDTRRTHTALTESVTASADVRSVQVLYPTASAGSAPTVARSNAEGNAVVTVSAPADDRTLTVAQPAVGATATASKVHGGSGLLVVDRRTDGALRSAWADGATTLAEDGRPLVAVESPGSLALRLGGGSAEVVATGTSPTATVGDVGFAPVAVDGACGLSVQDGRTVLALNRERRATLRSSAGNSVPGADAGPARRVAAGATVTLDGTASCDADGDALAYRWELASAPAGSSWSLADATTPRPHLVADRVGPYRVRLVVTDPNGAESLEQEVVVIAGPQCGDGVDDDLDGRIDTDDPDCDGLTTPEPPSTVTTTTPVAPPTGPVAPGAQPILGDPRYTG